MKDEIRELRSLAYETARLSGTPIRCVSFLVHPSSFRLYPWLGEVA